MMTAISTSHRTDSSLAFFNKPLFLFEKHTWRLLLSSIRCNCTFPLTMTDPPRSDLCVLFHKKKMKQCSLVREKMERRLGILIDLSRNSEESSWVSWWFRVEYYKWLARGRLWWLQFPYLFSGLKWLILLLSFVMRFFPLKARAVDNGRCGVYILLMGCLIRWLWLFFYLKIYYNNIFLIVIFFWYQCIKII